MLPPIYNTETHATQSSIQTALYLVDHSTERDSYIGSLMEGYPREEQVYYHALKTLCLVAYRQGRLQQAGCWTATVMPRGGGICEVSHFATEGYFPASEANVPDHVVIGCEARLIEKLISDDPGDDVLVVEYKPAFVDWDTLY